MRTLSGSGSQCLAEALREVLSRNTRANYQICSSRLRARAHPKLVRGPRVICSRYRLDARTRTPERSRGGGGLRQTSAGARTTGGSRTVAHIIKCSTDATTRGMPTCTGTIAPAACSIIDEPAERYCRGGLLGSQMFPASEEIPGRFVSETHAGLEEEVTVRPDEICVAPLRLRSGQARDCEDHSHCE